ncbi:ATP synthase gamma chain [Trichinella spiralis]|uniref:ATP synthase gamma chain n=1 Tax=Trichinella spiralis TaxID=6334 RepID=UPI0001EFEC97|nr:ATP synthase gamma chain [Trichinella spiralis]
MINPFFFTLQLFLFKANLPLCLLPRSFRPWQQDRHQLAAVFLSSILYSPSSKTVCPCPVSVLLDGILCHAHLNLTTITTTGRLLNRTDIAAAHNSAAVHHQQLSRRRQYGK